MRRTVQDVNRETVQTVRGYGKRIADRRYAMRDRYPNQEALADAVGVRRATVSDWEREKYPPVDHLGLLAEALNVTPEWIMEGDTIAVHERPEPYTMPGGPSRITRMLDELDRPDEIKRWDSVLGIGTRLVAVCRNVEKVEATRDELLESLYMARKWAIEAEDAINELHQELRRRDREADGSGGA